MTYCKNFELPALPKDVFTALTNPDQLSTWFAEEVDVDLRVGGAYRFWGRHTLWVPSDKQANQRITQLEPERTLGFEWTWQGCASDVELSLVASSVGTRVEVRHSFEPASDAPIGDGGRLSGPLRTAREMAESDEPERAHDLIVDAFWDLAMANLRHYLEDRTPFLLPLLDGSNEVDISIVIRASAEQVFRALTSQQGLIEWMGADAPVVELTDGGAYTYGWQIVSEGKKVDAGPRRVVEFVTDELLVHDWFWPGQPPSEVRWELSSIDGGTRLRLTHRGFDEEPMSYKVGWASGLFVLVQILGGEEVPSWLSQER